jgi:hypothetical protein
LFRILETRSTTSIARRRHHNVDTPDDELTVGPTGCEATRVSTGSAAFSSRENRKRRWPNSPTQQNGPVARRRGLHRGRIADIMDARRTVKSRLMRARLSLRNLGHYE